LGFGAFLLTTIFAVQLNLLGDLQLDSATERANLVLIDIQADQRETVTTILSQEAVAPGTLVPIVPMRIAAVNGQEVGVIVGRGGVVARDSTTPEDDEMGSLWAWRREYRSTYRGTIGPAERVTAGRCVTADDAGSGSESDPVAISVEQDVARELGLDLGDIVVWNVQGARIHSVVRSLREVSWARFEPNFFVI